MKTRLKKLRKIITLCGIMIFAAVMFACDTAALKSTITFNADFSGSRVIEIELSATPVEDSGNTNTNVTYPGLKGIPYYRIRKHGNDLKTYLESALSADSYTADYAWKVEVDGSSLKQSTNPKYPKFYDGSEIIKITFEFDNFAEYTAQMRALASFGGTSLQFSTGGFDYEYKDPTLTFDMDAKTVKYFENGANMRYMYYGVWNKMVKDTSMVTIGTCYHPDGTTFTVEKGNSESDMLKDGIKCKSLSLSANGSSAVLMALTQGDEGASKGNGNNYYDTEMTLTTRTAWKDFFTGPITSTTANSITYTGGNEDFRWYAADAEGLPTGEPLTAAATYTHTFGASETAKKVVGVDGTAHYIKTLSVPVVTEWTVTFKDWDDTVLGTVVVEDGENVPASEIPVISDPRDDGKVFKNWDKTTNNITQNTTIKAVYGDAPTGDNDSDTDKTTNCGSVTSTGFGSVAGCLALAAGIFVVSKKRSNAKV